MFQWRLARRRVRVCEGSKLRMLSPMIGRLALAAAAGLLALVAAGAASAQSATPQTQPTLVEINRWLDANIDQGPDWLIVRKSRRSGGVIYMINVERFDYVRPELETWMRVEYMDPPVNGPLSEHRRVMVSCYGNKGYRVAERIFYSEHNVDGDVLGHHYPQNENGVPAPGSEYADYADRACELWAARTVEELSRRRTVNPGIL